MFLNIDIPLMSTQLFIACAVSQLQYIIYKS